MNSLFKKAQPHLIAIAVFLLIAIIYCQPALQGKVLNQVDVQQYKGMVQQSEEYFEKYGKYPLWTNSLFSGMPTYSIKFYASHKVTLNYFYIILTLGLPKPVSYFFLASICFYFLCVVLRIRPWLGVLAAIAFAYSTYDPVIVFAGHESKIKALAMAPAVIGSFFLLLQGRYLWGTALFAITFALQVETQHMQIAYYTGITLGILSIFFLVKSIREGRTLDALKPLGLAAMAAVIGIACYAESILPLREYAKETMRGGRSELTPVDKKNSTEGGLDKEYAFRWSYGISETLTFISPGIYGGSNGGREHTGSTNFTEKMSEIGVAEDVALNEVNRYSYWGDQPHTSGPVYFGAVMCVLFIFAMVYFKDWNKWWILTAVIFAIILSWGRNLEAVNYFLFDYLPLYNKFRAPSMSLVIPQILIPMFSAMALESMLTQNPPKDELFKKLKLTAFISGGIIALILLFSVAADFVGPNDTLIRENYARSLGGQQPSAEAQQQVTQIAQSLVKALQEDRKSLLYSDLFRSVIFIALALVLLGAYIKNKIKPVVLLAALTIISSFDLLAVGRRYLNNDSFIENDESQTAFVASPADQAILQDPNKPFRVFDNSDPEGPWNSARAAYFHNSVGGYHPAKLALFQDLIERQLSNQNMEVFNMLNTRYFIFPNPQNGQPVAQQNPGAFGPAWMVKHVKIVNTADEEMKMLDSLSLRDTAVVQEKFRNGLSGQLSHDSSGTISVSEYLNDKITYKYSARSPQFVVFSEIYYPHGWKAFIDGREATIVKTNYLLRGLSVPAGDHTIEFRFEPESYRTGNTLKLIGTLIAYLLLIAAIVFQFKKTKPSTTTSRKTGDS